MHRIEGIIRRGLGNFCYFWAKPALPAAPNPTDKHYRIRKTASAMKQMGMILLSLLYSLGLLGQYDAVNYNHTYVENIGCVRFGIAGYQNTFPLVELGSEVQLQLDFDDFDARGKTYVYRITHCDMNWNPSNLAPLDYIDGYEEDYVRELSFSFQTVNNFAHYELIIPNRDVRWTKSGNYLLTIYEDEDEKRPVITRRFVVVDRKVSISAQVVRPAVVSKLQTHQEIDFSIDPQQLTIRSPMQEVRATVLQNGRWDNAIQGLQPSLLRLTTMIFDYQDRIAFPAGNEFRFLDLRTLRNPSRQFIQYIGVSDQQIDVTVQPDQVRHMRPYLSFTDLNGDFVIENFDQPNAMLSGDYVNTLFQLKRDDAYYDYDVYIYGALSEWQLKPAFRMEYNPALPGYVGKVLLKQGYYNYAYVLVPRELPRGKLPVPDWSDTEGNFSEAENNYHILIYYRPVGGRYDQLVGVSTVSSWR